MQRKSRLTLVMMAILLVVGMVGIQPAKPVQAANPLRISQAFGGGGSVGSPYTHDFFEIYNSGTSPVSLAGMSIQYAGATGAGNFGATATQRTELPEVLLGPGQYYLIQEGGGTNGSPLPTPDLIDATAILVSATGGKVALVNSQVSLGCNGGSAPCGPEQLALIIDLVGFGGANFYEGTAATPAPSNSTSVIRKEGGCTDTDQNGADFEALTPVARNTASPAHACGPVEIFPTELFFSEYIEGSSNNKALEIYNGTGAAVALSNYQILYFNNGSPTPTITYPLTGTVAAGDVFVLTTDTADPILKAAADVILAYPSVVHYNGDDALALQKISPLTTLDVIGQIGSDPGTFWGTEPITTAEHTLTRMETICEGDPEGSDSFDPALEWDGFAQNNYTFIGFHDTNCFPPTEEAPTVLSVVPADGSMAQKTDNITITFSEPVTVVEPWFSVSCGTSGAHTAAVTDADPTFTLNPDLDFVVGETCTVTIDHTKVNDDDLDDATADFMVADYIFSFTIAPGCGDPYTFIYDIQGTGASSPLVGQTVTTEGVVVGDFQVGGKNGYYIQEPNADADALTSDGVFVYNTTVAANVGDRVRVTGLITEWVTGTGGTMTELTPASPASSNVLLCSTGNTITPTPVTLPVTAVSDFEKYESMLVTFPQSLIVSEYFNFDRYGEIVLTATRHMTPTAFVEPGLDSVAAAQAYLLDRITLDDGRTAQNPDPAIHPNGLTFNMTNLFRGGATVTNATGILDFYQSLYRLQPTTGAVYADVNPRTTAPEITEADLKVASFNVLNYFVTLDDGTHDICGPDGIQECRGADDIGEFDRQKAKILSALVAIDADVFGLMEIENDSPISGNDAVADLVTGLNAIEGEGTYAYIDTNAIGGDAIKQAILYKPASVTPVGDYLILDSSIDPRFIDTANRPVLAQVFVDNVTGEDFVVAVNHLKSKGSVCVGDPDLGDGAGNCNLTRKAAAEALVDWLSNPTYFPDVEKALIIGDLNSYDKEDPIDMIKLGADDTADTADDYLDMIFEKRGELAYGYVYDGQIGYLDHALANEAMAESIVDVNFWHINADEPDLIDYDTSFKLPAQDALYAPDAYRSSDHDPVIVTLSFAPLTVTNVDLLQSTDPLTLETTATPVPGSLATGFTMVLDPAVEWYYFDTDTITSSRPLADGSYPFYLEGTTTELFTLVVSGTDYFLRDTYKNDGTPLRVQGNFPLGTYTYVGDVMDGYGFTDEVSLTITFVAPLAVTEVALAQSTDPLTIETTATPVPGTLAEGFTMALDPAIAWYYFDTDLITSNRPLADGIYPFYLEGTTTELFTLVVNGMDYFLRDTYANDGTPLRVQGNFPLGTYTYVGEVMDDLGSTDEVSLTITFVAPLAVTDVGLVQSTDLATWTPVEGNLADGYAMNLDALVEYYYLDAENVTSNRTLGDGSYPFFMTGNPGAEFFAYWAERGVVEGASGWQALMWPIINGDAPMFYLKVEGTSLTLIDGLQGAPNPLRVNGAYYPGLYTFSGLVADEFGFEDELDVSIFFNDMPIAEDQAVTTPEETPIDITLTAMDIEGDPLVYAIAAQPAHGTVTLVGNIATYTPALDFFGEDSFTFTANDGTVDSQIATVTITMTDLKDQVQAVDDEYTTDEDTALIIAAPGVLANDIDVDNNNRAASLVTGVQHGSLSLLGDGSFTYTPDPDFFGIDTFVYKLITYPAPQNLWTDEATVTITINPVGDAPVLGMIEDATIPELVEFSFTAMATDVDLPAQVLTFSLVGAPEGAAITAGGVFTWTPSELQGPGEFTFTVMVCDDTAPTPLCDEQEVTLTVTEVNTAPVADDLTASTLEETAVDITLVASDVEDDPLTYAIIDQPTHGSVTLVDDVATYTPDLDFNGEDSFTYKANDGLVDSEMAVVTITVTPVNDAPVAVEDAYATNEDEVLTVVVEDGVLANDTDIDGDVLTAILVDDVSNGTLALADDGSFVYTPAENFFGTDSFTYKASDGTLESEIVTVTLTINPVNDWVVANDDEYETMAGVTLEVAAPGVLDNDELLDPNETVTLEVLVQPAGGTLTLNDDGSFTYVPNAGFFGVDTFEYQLNTTVLLNGEFSDTAIVSIKVTAKQIFLPLIFR